MKPAKRFRKAKKHFKKGFNHLEDSKEYFPIDSPGVPYMTGLVNDTVQMVEEAMGGGHVIGDGEGGGIEGSPMSPGSGGQPMGGQAPVTSPDGGVGYMSFAGPLMTAAQIGYLRAKGIGSADIATLRQSHKRFRKGFKHIVELPLANVVRQQALNNYAKTANFFHGLYGGETTAPEPRI